MNIILARTLCAVAVVALLFAGLGFALHRHQEHEQALAAFAEARRMAVTHGQVAMVADQAMARLDQARSILARLGPAPREWTTYPLTVKAEMDPVQTQHVLRLLGKTDAWTFVRTQELVMRSTCGLEPCAVFQVDLRAEAYAPVKHHQWDQHGSDIY